MLPFETLQAYLHHSAAQGRHVAHIPPFTCYFDPGTDFPFFNYAIPTHRVGGDLSNSLTVLRGLFEEHARHPRFEYIEPFAPELAASLEAAGFVREGRYPLMMCTRESFRPAPEVPGLVTVRLTEASELVDALAYRTTQARGFDPDNATSATEAEGQETLRQVAASKGASFLASLHGAPAAVAAYTVPFNGLTEIAGIATVPEFRRQGIATAITAEAVAAAFAEGVETTFLSAADLAAARVYERVGFRHAGDVLVYREPDRSYGVTDHEAVPLG